MCAAVVLVAVQIRGDLQPKETSLGIRRSSKGRLGSGQGGVGGNRYGLLDYILSNRSGGHSRLHHRFASLALLLHSCDFQKFRRTRRHDLLGFHGQQVPERGFKPREKPFVQPCFHRYVPLYALYAPSAPRPAPASCAAVPGCWAYAIVLELTGAGSPRTMLEYHDNWSCP